MMMPIHKRRLEESIHFTAFPDEILFQVLAYLQPEEIWNVCSRSARISEIGTTRLQGIAVQEDPLLEEIFQSLHPEKKNETSGDSQTVSSVRPVTLWKNLVVGRRNCQRSSMATGFDYHNVWPGGVPACGDDFVPDWVHPLSAYQFAVRLWKKGEGGNLSSITATLPRQQDRWGNSIFLYLQSDVGWKGQEAVKARAIAERLQSGKYYALEILVSAVTNMDNQGRWTLYSSLRPLQPYGGGSFEEYEAMPWFLGDIEERLHSRVGKWAMLPFVRVKPVVSDNHRSRIQLQFHWRDPQGRKHGLLGPLNRLVLLKHRCNQTYKTDAVHDRDSVKKPRCLRTHMAGLENYFPKPLDAYSFRIDVHKFSNPTEKCSFLANPPEQALQDEQVLRFEIPKEHHNRFPWAEDYVDETRFFFRSWVPEVEFDETISIYAIDRRTGKQAKLFQSEACYIFEFFCFHSFGGFEKSGALSQYSFGDNGSTIPVPVIGALMGEAWKAGDFFLADGESPPRTRSIDLNLSFECFSGEGKGTGRAYGTVDGLYEDFLTFLEKGLSYK